MGKAEPLGPTISHLQIRATKDSNTMIRHPGSTVNRQTLPYRIMEGLAVILDNRQAVKDPTSPFMPNAGGQGKIPKTKGSAIRRHHD